MNSARVLADDDPLVRRGHRPLRVRGEGSVLTPRAWAYQCSIELGHS
jgi:hypothetical protein